MNAPAPAPTVNVDAAIAKYIELRDRVEKIDSEAKAAKKPLLAAMEQISSVLLHVMNTAGGLTQLKSASGTAFLQKVSRCNVENFEETLRYMQQSGDWSLLTQSVSKTAVETYIDKHEIPPPGVKYTVLREIQVRRPS